MTDPPETAEAGKVWLGCLLVLYCIRAVTGRRGAPVVVQHSKSATFVVNALKSISSSTTSPCHPHKACCWTSRPLDYRPATPRVDEPRPVTVFVSFKGASKEAVSQKSNPLSLHAEMHTLR